MIVYSGSILVKVFQVTGHQVALQVAIPDLISSHRDILEGKLKGNMHEGILIPRSRLRLWAGYIDLAHHHWTDASGSGQAPGYLPQSGGGMGSRPHVSQNRAPQGFDCPCRPAAGLSCRARERGNPCLLATGAPEDAA